MFIKEENPAGADSLEKYIDIKYYGETLMFKVSILFNFKCCANHRPVAGQIHWQTLSHNVVSSTLRHERDSNS